MERYLPDPYIFVAILTLIVFLLGLGLTDSGPLDMVVHWGDGFWGLSIIYDANGYCVSCRVRFGN